MQNKFHNALIAALIFLLSFNVYYFFVRRDVGPKYYLRKMISKPSDEILQLPIYQDLVEEYRILNQALPGTAHIVFVGDSIIKRFNTEEILRKESVLNRGIFSDTTVGLKHRLQENINNLDIDKLFILIGFNDLKYRENEAILQNIEDILLQANARKKYVLSLLPVDSEEKALNARIDAINAALSARATNGQYHYIDLNAKFKDPNGGIAPELTRDGIHPNYQGYRIWYSVIKDHL